MKLKFSIASPIDHDFDYEEELGLKDLGLNDELWAEMTNEEQQEALSRKAKAIASRYVDYWIEVVE